MIIIIIITIIIIIIITIIIIIIIIVKKISKNAIFSVDIRLTLFTIVLLHC